MAGKSLVLLRNTERNVFRRCRQRWEWTYLRGLEPKHRSGALTFGSLVHEAFASWYVPGRKRGRLPAETFAELFDKQPQEFDQWDEEGNRVDARTLGVTMLNEYVEHYDTDPHLFILQPELKFQIDIYDKRGRYLCTLVGSIDGVARSQTTGRMTLLEHKTAKSISEIRINSGYGEQGMNYWWAATMWLRHIGELGQEEIIDSVVYNILRKGMPDERPRNEDGHYLNKPKKDALSARCAELGLRRTGKVDDLIERLEGAGEDWELLGEISKKQPPPLFDRQELILGTEQLRIFEDRLRKQAYEMSLVRQGKIPVYKNPTRDCDWDCPARDVCEVHEMGGDWESMLEFDFRPWDPYSEHELLEDRSG